MRHIGGRGVRSPVSVVPVVPDGHGGPHTKWSYWSAYFSLTAS